MTTHTMTPWGKPRPTARKFDAWIIPTPHGDMIIQTNPGCGEREHEANARHIVKCVNMHDELLEALRACVIPLERLGDFVGNTDKGGVSGLGPFDRCAILLAVRDALAKAERGEA